MSWDFRARSPRLPVIRRQGFSNATCSTYILPTAVDSQSTRHRGDLNGTAVVTHLSCSSSHSISRLLLPLKIEKRMPSFLSTQQSTQQRRYIV